MSKQLALNGQNKAEKRRELDFYPTPQNVTHALMQFLLKNDRIDTDTRVWEPACGNGAMSKVIESYGIKVYSSDIRDTGYGSPYLDFIAHHGNSDFDAIITNPPFNQSADFIEKATQKHRIVCMLLKSQYWHAKNRYELFKKNSPTYILPLTWKPDFLEHEKGKKGAPTMEVAWSVWIKGIHETRYIPLLKPD